MDLPYHTPLSVEQQSQLGIDPPQVLALADKVRFAEIDNQNHVNNKAYLTWLETLRVAYFQRYCMPYFEGARPRILLHSISLRYVKEILPGESYVATAQTTSFRTRSFTLEQQIWSGDLRARMAAVIVVGAPDGGKLALPEALKDAFMTRDGAQAE